MSSGDLSDVYLAVTSSDMDSARALKLFLPEVAGDPVFRRWLLESRELACRVSDPAIVGVIEIAERDHYLYSVREMIFGSSLAALIRKGPVEIEVATGVIDRVARALRTLLDSSIPPLRALTPRHVMITDEGGVRLLGHELAVARAALVPGPGTMAYTAPEALAHKEVAESASVFALGTVLFEALTAKSAFPRDGLDRTRNAVERGELSDLRIAESRPELRALVLSMLALDPGSRPRLDDVQASLSVMASEDLPAQLRHALTTSLSLERQAQQRIIEAAIARAKRAKLRASALPPKPPSAPTAIPRVVVADDVTQPGLRLDADTLARISAARVGATGDLEHQIVRRSDAASSPSDAPPSGAKPAAEGSMRKLGRYELFSEIGVGRDTVVYLGRDPHINRKVAVKVLDTRVHADETRLALFQREARLWSRVRHHRLPVLLDAGRDGPLFFLAFTHLEGEPLSKHLEPERRLTSQRARLVLNDLAEALEHLHELGIAHGDLRTSNVIIGAHGHAFLLDLSLAESSAEPQHPDRANNVSANAPETVTRGAYSRRSDQFSLGVIVYRLLVGEAPFLASGKANARLALKEHQPRPPATRRSDVDPQLSAIVMRLLEKEAARRYRNVGELLTELRREQAHETSEREDASETQGFVDALTEMLERATAVGPAEIAESTRPAVLAREVARRLRTGPIVERRASVAAALVQLAERVASDDAERTVLASIAPPAVRNVLIEVMRALEGDPQPLPLPAEIAFVAVRYARALRPNGEQRRASPRTAVVELRSDAVAGRVGADVVEALVDHLREVISALDVPDREPPPRRILLMGESPLTPELEERLRIAGYVLGRSRDGSEVLRSNRFDAVIVDGATGLALLPRLRADSADTVLIVTNAGVERPKSIEGPSEVFEAIPLPETLLGALSRLLDR